MLDRAGFESVPFRRVDLGGLDRRRDRRSPRSDRRSIFAVVPNSKTSSNPSSRQSSVRVSRRWCSGKGSSVDPFRLNRSSKPQFLLTKSLTYFLSDVPIFFSLNFPCH